MQSVISKNMIRDYVALTKPKIISLLLITALGGLFLASKGLPQWQIVWVVLFAGSLAAGGANAINHFLDRDIDNIMQRTKERPVAGKRVLPKNALIFGILLNIIAFVLLILFATWLSAILTLAATLVYVFVYTIGLKRSTPQNIVIGGAAGAFPPLIAWAAVTGDIGLGAVYLFAIVFFWTPPHFWALALMIKDDYAEAGIPMLPVVKGDAETKKAIVLYVVLLLALTLMMLVTREVGWIYGIASACLGIGYLYYAIQLYRSEGILKAKPAYLYSLAYLALLFVFVMIDASVAI
ncbi:MAG: protoheme IX farnesyltransferase [Chloroflexi bacterium]|nr:protoheme IX farnesyltransferase [Chloroflexota bacterium]|tara:strand:- start:460 stop:1341 length:882 start_codon:yes stop_codon:yes gene_type:complete